MMIYGQTRVFFTMSRDGLLPPALAAIHPRYRTPHVVTAITGAVVCVFAAFFPVGQLASISNSGTLFAFAAVSVAVLVLRRVDPGRHRPFRCPMVAVTAPAAAAGCVFLFISLDSKSKVLFFVWSSLGLVVYFTYSRSRSHVGRGGAAGEGYGAAVAVEVELRAATTAAPAPAARSGSGSGLGSASMGNLL